MKICIFGAGAIGGYLAVKLTQAGADVSVVARGPHLSAMQNKGLTLLENGKGAATVPVKASEDPASLGVQDYVIVTLKAHSVPAVVGNMQPLIPIIAWLPESWNAAGTKHSAPTSNCRSSMIASHVRARRNCLSQNVDRSSRWPKTSQRSGMLHQQHPKTVR